MLPRGLYACGGASFFFVCGWPGFRALVTAAHSRSVGGGRTVGCVMCGECLIYKRPPSLYRTETRHTAWAGLRREDEMRSAPKRPTRAPLDLTQEPTAGGLIVSAVHLAHTTAIPLQLALAVAQQHTTDSVKMIVRPRPSRSARGKTCAHCWDSDGLREARASCSAPSGLRTSQPCGKALGLQLDQRRRGGHRVRDVRGDFRIGVDSSIVLEREVLR